MDKIKVQQILVAAGLDPAPREGAVLVQAAAGDAVILQALLARRLKGEPLAYVVGFQPFWARDWAVNPAVLIPRPDSEVLVQAVLDLLPEQSDLRVAEVGVGSGALLGSILAERPHLQGVGTDLMADALAVAETNLREAGVLARAQLVCTDVLAGIAGGFDVIYSNPPYIAAAEYAQLESGVRDWEPQAALLGGVMGTEFYEILAVQAHERLHKGGWLAVEIGATQRVAVQAIFARQRYQNIQAKQDLAGRDRVVLAQT